MKKGSYGRSKLVGHTPVQRQWIFRTDNSGFIDPSYIVIFYINCNNTNVTTLIDIGFPILSIPTSQLKLVSTSYFYDITKTIQTYGSGCYFFAWVNNSGQIQDNQLLLGNNGSDTNLDCIEFTPAIEVLWRSGSQFNPITLIRGVYIKNPALPMNSLNIANENELFLTTGNPQK